MKNDYFDYNDITDLNHTYDIMISESRAGYINYLEEQNAVLKKALELAVETITEEGCDNCEFRFNCKKYYGGSTLEDCKNTFIEQAKEIMK